MPCGVHHTCVQCVVHVWLPKMLRVRCSICFLQVHAALAAAEPADSWLPATEPHMAEAAGHRFTVGHGPFPRALSRLSSALTSVPLLSPQAYAMTDNAT